MTEVDAGALDEVAKTTAPPEAGKAKEMGVIIEASTVPARSWWTIAWMMSRKLSIDMSATWLPVGKKEAGSAMAAGADSDRLNRALQH